MTHTASNKIEYVKFFAVIAGILIVAYTLTTTLPSETSFWVTYMRFVMGVFFITFSIFQLLGYKSFVEMFADYDPIAKRSKLYAYAYPFIGILLGIAYLADALAPWRDLVTAIVMLIGAYGVWHSIKTKRNEVHCACLGTIIKLPLSTITLVEDLAMGLMALIMLLPASGFTGATTLTDSVRSLAVAQVQAAYAAEITPTGNIVTHKITAGESIAEIINGYSTKVWTYNGSVPGPEIRITLGDTLKINFTNNLPIDTTVHFHGIRVPNEMDGVPGVTQDPIKPGESFTYEFTPKDAGTYWYHPHVRTSEEMGRGLYGVIIVEDSTANEYSQDKVLVIDDWRLDQNGQIAEPFNNPHDTAHAGRLGNVITVNGKTNGSFYAAPGERLRLRLVNTSNARIYKLNFGAMDVTGIAVDGLYAREAFDPNGFTFAPGNRIDVDVTIPNDADGTDYVVTDVYTEQQIPLVRIIVDGEEVINKNIHIPFNSEVPLWDGFRNVSPDISYYFDGGMSHMGMMGTNSGVWKINSKSFPDYDMGSLPLNEFRIIRFENPTLFPHPMHLHGQFFKIVSRNGRPVDERFFRDTAIVEPDEVLDIALVAQDAGVWALHCHVLEHADGGMMTLVEVE